MRVVSDVSKHGVEGFTLRLAGVVSVQRIANQVLSHAPHVQLPLLDSLSTYCFVATTHLEAFFFCCASALNLFKPFRRKLHMLSNVYLSNVYLVKLSLFSNSMSDTY